MPVREICPIRCVAVALVMPRLTNRVVWRQFLAYAEPEGNLSKRVVGEPPVLVEDAAVLGLVEPHQSERLVLGHPVEQVLDLGELASRRPDRVLGQQHRLAGEGPHLRDGLAEDAGEGVGRR